MEVYLYDEIVEQHWIDSDGNEHGFTPDDLAESLRDATDGEIVNIYVNSPGGSVFASVAMTSEIRRALQRGVHVVACVDGIAASAASFLIMACESIEMYQGTMLMLHKPWTYAIGNADDLRKSAADLDDIQNGTCMPLYKSKLISTEEILEELVTDESWLSANKAAEIFNISIKEEQKDVRALIDSDIVAKYGYKHIPEQLLKPEQKEKTVPEEAQPPVDYSEWEQRIQSFIKED